MCQAIYTPLSQHDEISDIEDAFIIEAARATIGEEAELIQIVPEWDEENQIWVFEV